MKKYFMNSKPRGQWPRGFIIYLSERNFPLCYVSDDQCRYRHERHICKTAYKVNNRYEKRGNPQKEKELGLFLQSIVEKDDSFYS